MIDTHPPGTVDARPTVLVVDDERAIRELVAALLEDEGYRVRRARDGLEALNLVEGNCIDLVLSDVRMPRLDGATLARRIRQRGYDLPVILMSAVYADVDVPGVQFVPKPFEITLLFSAIAGALGVGKRPIS
jgi:CheY-like chemotaxis protein